MYRLAACFTRKSIGAHEIDVVQNTIHILLQVSSDILLPKIMKIGSRVKKLLQKIKRV